MQDFTDIHRNISQFLILSFCRGLDDYHFRKDNVFADADFGEIASENYSLLEDGVITDFDVVGTFDQTFFSD